MFRTLVRRAAERARPQLDIPATGTYKLKKVWPPDFRNLSPQEQLKFEKRYKRRAQIASARPRWDKMVKLAQLFSITFVVVYSVLFMDWKNEHQPFDGVRSKFWSLFGYSSTEGLGEQGKDTKDTRFPSPTGK